MVDDPVGREVRAIFARLAALSPHEQPLVIAGVLAIWTLENHGDAKTEALGMLCKMSSELMRLTIARGKDDANRNA